MRTSLSSLCSHRKPCETRGAHAYIYYCTCRVQLMPFIILGIGVDDIFVLVRSMEEVNAEHAGAPIPERFRRALNVGGMSITVTSATNFVAFMFGSLTSIPAVKWCAPNVNPTIPSYSMPPELLLAVMVLRTYAWTP